MRFRLGAALVSVALLAPLGCKSSPGADPGPDAGDGDPDAGGDGDGVLPEVPAQAGVVYAVHYHDTTLLSYRIDGDHPVAGPVLDLGAVSHNLALDPVGDLLAAVSDVGRKVTLIRVGRPAAPEDPLAEPTVAATIDMTDRPLFAVFHPYRRRLLVLAAPPTDGLLTELALHAFDVETPEAPRPLDGWPHSIPVTTSFDLDAAREVLFLVELTTRELHGFDLRDDRFAPLPGDPIDLRQHYPETNQFAFQARNLTADPYRNRLYAVRAQGAMSEVIAFEYPPPIPRGAARYGDFAAMGDLQKLDDPFDVSVPPAERTNLLGGYKIGVDLGDGSLFVSADAWNGSSASAFVFGLDADLELATGCEEFDGFGCFVRNHIDGEPSAYLRTDGAMCVDYTHGVVAATSLSQASETSPGRLHFFRYQDDLSMSPWLSEAGADLAAGALPISIACH